MLSGHKVDLEQIAAMQWADAHDTILTTLYNDKNYFMIKGQDDTHIGFEWLKESPEEMINFIIDKMNIQSTISLTKAVDGISTRKVQVTPGTELCPQRWMKAPNREKIERYSNSDLVRKVSSKLGYNKTGL